MQDQESSKTKVLVQNIIQRANRAREWLAKHDKATKKISVPEHDGFSLKKLWAFVGPGFLIAIAYIDPGNFATDITAGAQFNYRMIWVLLFASIMGLCLQVLTARLGMVTGKHLAIVCRNEYGDKSALTIIVWLITESAMIASDIPEIVGSAFALNILFGLPLWAGVLITAIDTMILLALQYFGIRYLEAFIGSLVGIISICFVVELWLSPIHWTSGDCPTDWCSHFPADKCPPNYCGFFLAGFIPLMTQDGLYVAISLLGAVVMPHNLYLHSALVLSRDVKQDRKSLTDANRYNWIESTLALSVSALINVCILGVAGAIFYPSDTNDYSVDFSDPDLGDTSQLLGNFLGKGATIIFGIALLASGQSSTLTGTYAGQFVMEGFMEIKLPLWQRNLITRSVGIVPSLVVAIIAGKQGSTTLIVLASAILSFQLPFALIPLLKFTSSKIKMGPFANSKAVTVIVSILATLVIAANVFLIYGLFWGDGGVMSNIESLAGRVMLTIVLVIIGICYFLLLGYLVYRPVKVATEFKGDMEDEVMDLPKFSDEESIIEMSEAETRNEEDLSSMVDKDLPDDEKKSLRDSIEDKSSQTSSIYDQDESTSSLTENESEDQGHEHLIEDK